LRTGILAPIVLLAACAASAPATREEAIELDNACWDAIRRFKQAAPGLNDRFAESAGWAIFPRIDKGAVGIGGAFGRGMAYDRTGRILGFVSLSRASIGFQLGGQSYAELVLFKTRPALRRLTAGDFQLSAETSAVVLKDGAALSATFTDGIMVVTMDERGVMYEASVGGQKLDFERRD